MNREPSEETFLHDVSKHQMKVFMDNGTYRHLRFRNPQSSNMWFDIVTWPGRLTYTGDMGTFVFARLEDMFEFFRTDRIHAKDRKLEINTGYWGEKLQAVDRCGTDSGYLDFSPDRLREHVEERVKDWIQECSIPYDCSSEEEAAARSRFEEKLREAVEEDIYRYLDDGEHEARRAVNDFSFQPEEYYGHRRPKYEFSDTWEWNCREYTFRFVWCCYALAWSIEQYDDFKDRAVGVECLST